MLGRHRFISIPARRAADMQFALLSDKRATGQYSSIKLSAIANPLSHAPKPASIIRALDHFQSQGCSQSPAFTGLLCMYSTLRRNASRVFTE